MAEMTVQRALQKLKSLKNKAASAQIPTHSSVRRGVNDYAAVVIPDQKIEGLYTVDQFKEQAKKKFDDFEKVFKDINKYKTAIYNSNSKTKVTIGGKEMTVSDAIIKREQYPILKAYYQHLLNCKANGQAQYNAALDKYNDAVNKITETVLGKDTKTQQDPTKNAMAEAYAKNHKPELVLGFDEEDLKKKMDEIIAFEEEVDSALSENNAQTKITIED